MDVRRSINTKIWQDPWFDELDNTEKLIYLYLLTNQYTNLLGIYEQPGRRISIDTAVDKPTVNKVLEKFGKDKKVYRSGDWIWIVNWLKNQSWNPKMVRSIQNKFESLDNNLKESFKETNPSVYQQFIDYYDSLLIAYPYPTSKEVKSKEVNSERFKKEIGKVEIEVKTESEGETDSTATLTIPDSILNEFTTYKEEVLVEELKKFYEYNKKKSTNWKDQGHIEAAFKGWMKNVKSDPNDLETSYLPVIKSKIEAISNQVKGLSFNLKWMRYQYSLWAKETLDVIKTDQQAVSSYTARVVEIMNAFKKDVSPNGKENKNMGYQIQDILGIEDVELAKILSQFRINAKVEAKGIPPVFNMSGWDMVSIWVEINRLHPSVEIQKWKELSERVGIHNKEDNLVEN